MSHNLYKSKTSKRRMQGICGILLIALALTGLYAWETFGREQLLYTDTVVFREAAEANQIVTAGALGYLKAESSKMIEGAITDPNLVIGKETLHHIPAGAQLSEKYFTTATLASGSGKYIFAVPSSWMYAYPQTLRRGDTIYFYQIKNPGINDSAAGGSSFELAGLEDTAAKAPYPALAAKAAYVKDSSNREVVDVTPDRYDGSAVVSKIEIVATEEEYEKLKKIYESGYQFILLYD